MSKSIVESAKNLKNITATLSVRNQMRMASEYYSGMFDTSPVHVLEQISSSMEEDNELVELLQAGGVLCGKVLFDGQIYTKGDIVVISADDSNSLTVGIIQAILVRSSNVHFVARCYQAQRNDYMYFVSKNFICKSLIKPSQLADFKPLIKYGTDTHFKFYLHHHISYSHD